MGRRAARAIDEPGQPMADPVAAARRGELTPRLY
jgi:hypothetical protein